jgi:hypothetical protein
MGIPAPPEKAILIAAIFSRHAEALAWARAELSARWGDVLLQSPLFPFIETEYYAPSMGAALQKQLLAFSRLADLAEIAPIKLATNELEQNYAAKGVHPEERPLNIDPGHLTLSKFVLATTKDADHRLYLGQGIYAEVTLRYSQRAWRDQPWTYPNYRREDYKAFLLQCRERLKRL